jgi:DNA-binding PadR family transcriptional regulator
MTKKKYTISEEQKKEFAGVYLLEYMINTPYSPPIFLDGNDQDLETILVWLMAQGLIEIKGDEKYIPTQKGREHLKKFMARYSEYLTMFDIFCAVDLEAGEFAFESWEEFETDEEFQAFLDDDRWDDLRVAVADYKGMNAVEIVFMNFINEHRFGRDESGWQFDLLLGSVWDEILELCENSIQWEELGFEDEQGAVPAESVVEDIITQGTEIMLDLLGERPVEEINGKSTVVDAVYYVDEVGMPEPDPEQYKNYLDPKYKSKNWKN